MAIFLHRREEKLSRLQQLKTNPTTIIHFCSADTKLTVGHRAVLMGKPGEILATGFVIRSVRVCNSEEVTNEEFAEAPEIADSPEMLLLRLALWGASKSKVQVVRLEKL